METEGTDELERADTRPELTVLVLLRDQLQKLRIAESNRVSAAKALGEDGRAETHEIYAQRILDLENQVTKDVAGAVHEHPAWPWLQEIRGVAETSAALVLGYIDIRRSETVSALWRYAGYGVVDGHRERPIKGERLHYNARLKTMVWRLVDLQVRTRGPYRLIYDQAKHGYITTRMEPAKARAVLAKMNKEKAVDTVEPEQDERATPEDISDLQARADEERASGYWTLGHCEAAARRKAAKLFLSHLWEVWRTAEGLPVRGPYISDVPGHDIIDPWDFIKPKDT